MGLHVGLMAPKVVEVYGRDITHNLGDMARAADLYQVLWRPEELGLTTAKQLIEPLGKGLERLLADPDKFKALEVGNGWGTYLDLVDFVTHYQWSCTLYPDAVLEVSR